MGLGAGIDNAYGAMLRLTNSTLSGNRIGDGGASSLGAGLQNRGAADLLNVTITANDPIGLYSDRAGIVDEFGHPVTGPIAVKLRNTLVAGNNTADCSGAAITSQGHNLDGDATCGFGTPGDLPPQDARLGPLASNGGPTQTHALLFDSPAIDSGETCPGVDQRGVSRPLPADGACDIGAYEYDPAHSGRPTPTTTPAPTTADDSAPSFTFSLGANCRKGPSTQYESLGFGQVGEQVPIQGLSDPAGWYYVQLPAGTRCFAAGSTGEATGPLDELPIIPAPPLPVTPTPTATLAPPAAPVLSVSNQVCDAVQYVVRLSWKDVDGETGYRVYRDGMLIAALGANTTVYDDSSPDYNAHDYRVEAFNAAGMASSGALKSAGCVY
jgi:hypothetical protein